MTVQALTKRDEKLTAVASKIELGMTVVGATAIEDKLQDVCNNYQKLYYYTILLCTTI
jgi:magnesium-transporting ATPase (P-type)